jgi:hypothetical protein
MVLSPTTIARSAQFQSGFVATSIATHNCLHEFEQRRQLQAVLSG